MHRTALGDRGEHDTGLRLGQCLLPGLAQPGRLDQLARIAGDIAAPHEARSRALLAYSAYLGHAQLAHSTPELLPRAKDERRAYLDHALRALAAQSTA